MSLEIRVMLLALLILLIFISYLGLIHLRLSKEKEQSRHISNLIVGYFDNSDLEVKVFTFKPDWHENFTTLIETPPISRFRHSAILEGNLIEYIEKLTGHTINKIYWRFSLGINLARAESIPTYSFIESYRNTEAEVSENTAALDESGHPQIDPNHYEVSEITLEEYVDYPLDSSLNNIQGNFSIKPELAEATQLESISIRKTS